MKVSQGIDSHDTLSDTGASYLPYFPVLPSPWPPQSDPAQRLAPYHQRTVMAGLSVGDPLLPEGHRMPSEG